MQKTAKPNQRRERANKITVAILEDNTTMIKGIVAELDKPDIFICAVSNNVEQFLDQMKSCRPLIAIVDLRICQDYEAGFGVIERARQISLSTQYIIHTAYDKMENFHNGVNLGIRAFVSKNIYEKPLDEVVKLVFNGGTYYGNFLSEYLDKLKESSIQFDFDREDHSAEKNALSKKELEVLDLLDQDMSIDDIAVKIFVSKNTVKAHTRNIRGKLGTKTTLEAVRLYRLRKKLASSR